MLIPLVGVGAPIAAVLFAFSWLSLVNGSAVLPNLWTAIFGLAAAHLVAPTSQAAGPGLGARRRLARSDDVVPPHRGNRDGRRDQLSVLIRSRTSWRLIGIVWTGVAAGLLPWILEMSLRFGGPLEALKTAQTDRHFGIADAGTNLAWYLAVTDGEHAGEASSPGGVLWWSLLVVLSTVAIVRSRSPQRTTVILCAVATVFFAAEYIAFVSALAARFLLPAYALASIPAGVGLASLFRDGILARWAGSIVLLLVVPWMLWQGGVAGRLAEAHGKPQLIREVGDKLRELADGRPCAFMSPLGWPTIQFVSGCKGEGLPRPRGPSERELRELSTGSERTFVILRAEALPSSPLGSLTPIPVRTPERTWFVYPVSPPSPAHP